MRLERYVPVPEQILAVFRQHHEAMRVQMPVKTAEAEAHGAHRDWPWNGFILSFATLGGSANWEQRVHPRMQELDWAHVEGLTDTERALLFESVPNPRFRVRVAAWIEAAYQRMAAAGGPAVVREAYQRVEKDAAQLEWSGSMLRATAAV